MLKTHENLIDLGPSADTVKRAFWRGYLQAIGFTATTFVEDEGEGDSEPAFSGSGSFDDNWDMKNELYDELSFREVREMVSDCLGFLNSVADPENDAGLWEAIESDPEQAGTDFHFTRNGHGAGFWDGDWDEYGDKLTELAEPYGTLELAKWVAADGSESFSIRH